MILSMVLLFLRFGVRGAEKRIQTGVLDKGKTV
jgi:hypothetical protein